MRCSMRCASISFIWPTKNSFCSCELDLDLVDGAQHLGAPRDVVRRRKHREARHLLLQVAGQRVEDLQRFHLVVEERDADRHSPRSPPGRCRARRRARGKTPRLNSTSLRVYCISVRRLMASRCDELVALLQVQDHAVVFGRVADAVDRRYCRHDHAVRPLEDGLGRRQPHLLDVLVDRRILLDVEIARRNVGFRLVVVVVGDEVLDRVVREEFAELGVELRGERLVGRDHDAQDGRCAR